MPGETCQRCHRPFDVVWSAPNDLWHEVIGSPFGVYCPDCFDQMCDEHGVHPHFIAYREHVKTEGLSIPRFR